MTIKIIIAILMLAILFSLFMALLSLRRGERDDAKRTLARLRWRITLSIVLVLILWLAAQAGWLQPHGLPQLPASPTPVSP